MALPPALLQFVEQHGCFSGCYGSSSDLEAFTAANQPPVPMASVTCMDCLDHLGVLVSLLPKGMSTYQLAERLSRHVRTHRGYTLSEGGYHAKGPGFWFGAVFWASCNVFLLDGERSRQLGTDLDLLMLAFKHGVLKPPVPAMLNPSLFTVQPLFLDERQTLPAVGAKADLLSAPGVSLQPMKGWKKLTMAEFIPAPAPVAVPPVVASAPSAAAVLTRSPDTPDIERCPNCGAEIRQRTLLQQTYIGCMC
jgi:hypothetical protein